MSEHSTNGHGAESTEPNTGVDTALREKVLAPFDPREELDALAREWGPSRLAICAVNEELQDGVVLVWGMQHPSGRVDLLPEHRKLRGSFRSLDMAMRVTGSGLPFPLHLVWIDEPPVELTPEDEDDDTGFEGWEEGETESWREERYTGRREKDESAA